MTGILSKIAAFDTEMADCVGAIPFIGLVGQGEVQSPTPPSFVVQNPVQSLARAWKGACGQSGFCRQ